MITSYAGYELRVINNEDIYELFSCIDKNRKFLSEYLDFMADLTFDDASFAITKWRKMYKDSKGFEAGLFKGSKMVGMCGLTITSQYDQRADIGYWLAEEETGKGVMTNIVKNVVDIGFNDYGLNKITIMSVDTNLKSQNIAKRLGFYYDGVLRCHQKLNGKFRNLYVFSILKGEWELFYGKA